MLAPVSSHNYKCISPALKIRPFDPLLNLIEELSDIAERSIIYRIQPLRTPAYRISDKIGDIRCCDNQQCGYSCRNIIGDVVEPGGRPAEIFISIVFIPDH